MNKPLSDEVRALLPRTPSTRALPPGWRPAEAPNKPRGNPERAGAKVRDKANARAAELAPVIAGLRAEGFTTVRALCAELAVREVPTARGGKWSIREVQRTLERIEALPG